MTRSDGAPTNAVFGFVSMLTRLVNDPKDDHIAVIFDKARRTFRNDLHPEYKAHRTETPPELIPQFPMVREAVEAFDIACVEMDGFEADDLIATYTRLAVEQGAEVVIISSDKDLMQLVGDKVSMLDTMKNRTIGRAEVIEKFGVPPEKVIEVQALAGDSSDNVPGVPGIGIKTAAQLIEEYGDIETLLARANEIKQPKRRESLINFADQARLSKLLVTLKNDVPVPTPLESLVRRPPDPGRLKDFLARMEFRSLLARLGGAPPPPPPPSAPRAFVPSAPPIAAAQPQTISRDGYILIQDEATLVQWIAEARAQGFLAVDTETSSLDPLTCRLVGVSLALAPGKAAYIPLGHGKAGAAQGMFDLSGEKPPPQIPLERAIALLKPLLEAQSVLKIGHNIKYDIEVLAQHGIRIAPYDDSMLISYVLDAGRHQHNLDDLTLLHLGHANISFKEVTGSGKAQITFDQVPLEKARDYAAEDADVTLRLHALLKPRLLAERLVSVYETLERPLVDILAEMEMQGIKVDAVALRGLSEDFAKRLAELEGEIHALAGHPFNIGSPKQLGEVMFEEMKLPTQGKTGKTGAWSTGADALEELAEQGHQLPAKVLEWRQIAKLKSTYADALIAQINPKTGRVHTGFAQAVTATGRLSSSDPNLQNIPIRTEEGKKIRRAFIAEPGHVLLSADYSQIELRLVAHVADIAGLKEAFHQGEDIHAITASQVFGVPLANMDSATRRRAKAINFGIIYGISAFGLARQLGISNGEAKSYIEAYFARYPEIRAYMEVTKEEAKRLGYVVTPFGRRCHIQGMNDKNANLRGFAERAAINAPIQGGAADIIKKAMIRLPKALTEAGLKSRLLLQVHDELVLEVPEAEIEAARALVKSVMESAAALSVPLVVDTGVGKSWAEAH
jgi:DNA polymerase-1